MAELKAVRGDRGDNDAVGYSRLAAQQGEGRPETVGDEGGNAGSGGKKIEVIWSHV